MLFKAGRDFQRATRSASGSCPCDGHEIGVPTALEDRMHQPYRLELVPGLEEALRLRAPGLLGCALSGAGPSIIVFFERGFEEVCDLICQIFALHGRTAEVIAAKIAREEYPSTSKSELNAPLVSPDINVQPRTIPVAEIFAYFHQPEGPLIQNFASSAFGH